MRIRILAVGKIKEKYVLEGIHAFLDRLNRKWQVNIEEIPDEKIPDNPNPKDIQRAVQIETDRINQKIRPDHRVILLDIEGKMLSTQQLKKRMIILSDSGRISLDLIVGGSYGVDRGSLLKIDYGLSFSRMTFPHQLMRLMIVEQLYRVMQL